MLNNEQELVVNHHNGPALVVASAGSGKSKCLIERAFNLIVNNQVPSERVLMVTFSKKAAESLQQKAFAKFKGAFNFQASTFHSLGFSITKEFIKFCAGYKVGVQVIKDWEQKSIITKISEDMRWDIDYKEIQKRISLLKKNMVSPEASLEHMKNKAMPNSENMALAYRRYESEKQAINKLDFDDMIYLPNKLMEEYKSIREELQNRYDYAMIDECQDNNLSQFSLVTQLMAKNQNIMLIGDYRQAIFSFQGSVPETTIFSFKEHFPTGKVYILTKNYRSSQEIIDRANCLTLLMDNPYGESAIEAVKGAKNIHPSWDYLDSPDREASFVYEQIDAQRLSSPDLLWKDVAVLYRTNKQARAIEQVFVQNEIPYIIYGGTSFFKRREFQDVIKMLKVADNPVKNHDTIPEVINIASNRFQYTTRRLGKVFMEQIYAADQNFYLGLKGARLKFFQQKGVDDFFWFVREIQNKPTLAEKVNFIIDQSYLRYLRNEFGMEEENPGDSRLDILNEVKSVIAGHQNLQSLLDYVKQMEEYEGRKDDPNFDGVQLMTLHRSKGLEWEQVFLIGMNDTLLPHKYSGVMGESGWTPVDVSEERRLAYVGVTRAITHLHMTGHAMAQGGPSMFLSEMGILSRENEKASVESA